MRFLVFAALAGLGTYAVVDEGGGASAVAATESPRAERAASPIAASPIAASPIAASPIAASPIAEAPKPPPVPLPAAALELPAVARWLPEDQRCRRRGRRRRCNGPRRAPEPAGKPSLIADALGLGTHWAAAQLIRGEPQKPWIVAARRMGVAAPSFPLAWPVDEGRFGRGYGRGRAAGGPRHHRGVDVTAEVGTPVHAVEEALVAYADNTVSGYGNLLVLLHGGGQVSAYAHLSAIHVSAGQRVHRGQAVARAGNTGISRGPHLHFEWREAGTPRDPMDRFDRERWPGWMRRARPAAGGR